MLGWRSPRRDSTRGVCGRVFCIVARRQQEYVRRRACPDGAEHLCAHQMVLREARINIEFIDGIRLISLDAALRVEGIPSLELWDTVIDVFCECGACCCARMRAHEHVLVKGLHDQCMTME